MKQTERRLQELGKLIADAWEDRHLAERLKAEPKQVLAEYGIDLAPSMEVEALFCDDETTYVVLPFAGSDRGKVTPLKELPRSQGTDPVARTIVARAEQDPAFRNLLLEDVEAALNELGIKIPEEHTVAMAENTISKVHLVIPKAPKTELEHEELDKIAAGGSVQTTYQVTTQTTVEETTQTTTEETTAETTAEVAAEAVAVICAT